jgi:hypothetical protein
MTTTTATYDTDLAAANELLAERLTTAVDGNEFLAEQLPHSLDDALNNTWIEGLTVAEWAEMAARKVGI